MNTMRFSATPLTPIHIGNGDVLAPEDYLMDGDFLVRFNRGAVLHAMQPAVRRELESALDNNHFSKAQEIIRSSCDHRRHGLNRIAISDKSRSALLTLVKSPESTVRNREVHPFVYNPLNGQPYIPGSSIKGAIRTALINHFTQQHVAGIQPVLARTEQRYKAQILETEALNFEFRQLEGDSLRLLKVADVELPQDCTQIDQALQFQRGKGFNDIQMHFERLLSRGDGEQTCFNLELELDEVALNDRRVNALLGRKLNIDLIRQACNTFYTGRMLAEHQRFFSEDEEPEARYGAQGLVKFQNGKLLIARSVRDQGMLLRIGRFSHFESLSVDNLRQGWNIQKKQPIKEGSSRTLCRSAGLGKSVPMSFGWLLLRPAQ